MSSGIIGGADGPTVVYVSSSVNWPFIIGAAILIAGGLIAFFVLRKRKKQK
jgi:Na+-transporting methylmalonyl-CoA/oxaloacetate decarboxylase beta subunit